MYGAGDRLQGGATQQSSATTLSSYTYTRGVGRVGIGLPAFHQSRFTHSTRLTSQQIATNRVLQFGNKEQPRLFRSQCTTEDIRRYMEYIVRVVRAEAYDTTVMEASMDEESIMYLQTLFKTTVESYPRSLDSGLGCRYYPTTDGLFLTVGYRWEAVVTESRSNVEIPQGNMEPSHDQFRSCPRYKQNQNYEGSGRLLHSSRQPAWEQCTSCAIPTRVGRDDPRRGLF